MKKLGILILWVLLLPLGAASQRLSQPYAFFVAGHTYGSPLSIGYGLYEPFMEQVPQINAWPNLKMGFLTGDIAYYNTGDYLDSAQADMARFDVQVRVTAGNHDLGAAWIERFGEWYYYFWRDEDLFIVLCPVCDGWNILGDQWDFLEDCLWQQGLQARNIFILQHELTWWTPNEQFSGITINHPPSWPGPNNFWTEVEPLLRSTGRPTYVFAGDLGASPQVTAYHHYQSGKLHLIGSGMGGGLEDNYLIVEVRQDSVQIKRISFGSGQRSEVHPLVHRDETLDPQLSLDLTRGQIRAEIPGSGPARLHLHDMQGRLLLQESIARGRPFYLSLPHLPAGLYLLSYETDDTRGSQKVWIP